MSNDLLIAMVDWVENGREPGRLTASILQDGKVVMTRPVCPWPQRLRYRGKGDPDLAESFTCAAP